MNKRDSRHFDKVILLFLFALFLLVSPLMDIWAADNARWYSPYLLWILIIALAFVLQKRLDRS